jgi:hypothetical protein
MRASAVPQGLPEAGRFHAIDRDPFAVDLDHRQPLAVAPLQSGIAGDVDLVDLEA